MMAVSRAPIVEMVEVTSLNEQPDGTVTVSFTGGSVMSVQPDGTVQVRPAFTHGPYEKAVRDGNLLIFHPVVGGAYAFAFVERIP